MHIVPSGKFCQCLLRLLGPCRSPLAAIFIFFYFFCLKTNHTDQTLSCRDLKLGQHVVLPSPTQANETGPVGPVGPIGALVCKCLRFGLYLMNCESYKQNFFSPLISWVLANKKAPRTIWNQKRHIQQEILRSSANSSAWSYVGVVLRSDPFFFLRIQKSDRAEIQYGTFM